MAELQSPNEPVSFLSRAVSPPLPALSTSLSQADDISARIAVSENESQIEAIQERLQVLERAFLDISDKPKNPNDTSPHSIATNHESPASFTTFEGDSSFIKETSEASRSATSIVGGSASPAVINALSSLQDSLSKIESARQTYGAITTPLCGVTSSWTDHGQLERLCQKIYFPVGEVPSGSMALMHGMLFNVIREFSQHNDPVFAAYNLEDCADQCERNFDQYLERYEGLVIPTLENIQTLSMAASRAQDQSRLWLAWTYVSMGQTMCQTLGYHRESTYQNDTLEASQSKRHAFYSLYVIDKNLSLVLGRSSNFNDNDIDAEPFSISANPKQRPWDLYTHIIIRFAKIQGEVYDKLYSASTAKYSQHERSHITQELAMRITSLREELQSLKASDAYYSDVLQMAMESADFITYAVLTVVYRAELGFVDSVEISSRCYDAAKFSLESHLKCFTSLESRSIYQQMDYVKNTLLYPSFTPYVIVFTHAIATSDEIGIALLQDTVKSLARLQDLSPGSRRLYEVCRSFLNAAETIIGSQRRVDGLEQNEIGSLIFTKNPCETRPYGLGLNAGLPATWSGDASFGTVASGSYNGSNSDTLQFWSSWLGSTQSITDALQLDFTDGGLGGASHEECWS
ncbi:hypothetical protein FANTH_14296 [Fusarium anthophilum]|uniref:Xylanolytic transcriptional activator regulatory domain-containing protein n=1 Tax=Fusarium anthophilum TaxID=48485 RepID=A0A8H5DMN2_9HYPO|nr:hypothetical protein FANTH_14296 [Fusarium anthophilum]